MKRTIKIIGIISILLLLVLSTMPGVHAVSSQPPGSGSQAISPQAPEPRAKVSALLSLQVDAKVRAVEAGGVTQALEALEEGRVDILQAMQAMGMRTENLGMQRIFIHLSQEPTPSQIDELEAMGITPYPDSWIPPVGEHPTGFIVADMPIDKLQELAEKDYVVKLDTAERVLEPQNDLATQKINADDVWGLGYDGTGVTIAVLDSGLDVTHNDIPTPTFSKDYSNWPTLDDTIANQVTGHGTHVTGSALGRGTQSSGVYKGSAPDADLVFLKIGNDTTSSASYDAEVNAIKAAVDTYNADIITMSYGGWSTYHDGTSEPAQAVDYAVSQGAVVFISAGNDANDDEHYSGTVTASSTTGFIQVNLTGDVGTNTALVYNLVWYDGTGTSNDLELEYYNSSYTLLASTNQTQTESSRGTESEYSYHDYYVTNGTYYLKVKNNSTNSQFFHIYYTSAGNLAGAGSVTFQSPDPDYTIGSPADADSAIAVGSYNTRQYWWDYANVAMWYPNDPVDQISTFSSRGPRVDSGAPQKPNIVAPGLGIISARDNDVYPWPGGANTSFIDNDGPNRSNASGGSNDGNGPADYYLMQGTSMACPIAAGVAALILDKNPGWTPAQVKTALESTATDKGATGWDTIYGYGLIDAIDASASELEYGDAPDPTYPSLLASDGARHFQSPGAFLGLLSDGDNLDWELDANVPNLDLLDDGLVTTNITAGNPAETVTFEVTDLMAPSYDLRVNILIDLNADGDWTDAGEHVVQNQLITTTAAGTVGEVFDSTPFSTEGATPGSTWLRMTLTRHEIQELPWDGTMADAGLWGWDEFECGETEDWAITIEPVGALSAAEGTNTPSDHDWYWDPEADPYNEMLQIELTADATEDIILNSVTVEASGTGNDATGIASVDLVVDSNNNGLVDDAELPAIATGTYAVDDGSLTLTITGGYTVTQGTTKNFIIDYQMNSSPSVGDTFMATVTAVSAVGASTGLSILVSGLPIASATKTTVAVLAVTIDAVTTPTNVATQTLTGTMSEGLTVVLTADTAATFGAVSYPTSTTWSCDVTLVEGSNGITATADTSTTTATIVLDTTAPTVTDKSPAADETGVAVDAAVTATFGEDVTEVDLSGVTIAGATGVSATLDEATDIITIAHDDFDSGTSYTVTIPAGAVDDLAGNPSAEISWSFTTEGVLVSISALPSSVSLYVDVTQAITVTATYDDASTADVTATSTYVSDDETVATVSTGGLITAVAEGSATITVSYTEGGITETDTVSVTVSGVFDPWIYDDNDDGVIDKTEALEAITDYFALLITKAQALEVITLYFTP